MMILARTKSKRNPICIELKNYEGRKLLDIRRYFYDRKSCEYVPTRKGISLTRESFLEILGIIDHHRKEIKEWFNLDSDSASLENFKSLIEADGMSRSNAQEVVRSRAPKTAINKFDDRRYPFPYKYNAKGALHELEQNDGHPLHNRLGELAEKSDRPEEFAAGVSELLRNVFFTYFIAADRVSALSRGSDIEREELEDEWDRLLRTYIFQNN